ncbi:PDDEXK-like family protein [Mycoplasmopsis felifaucium]|uniref:hypothetical protein n=1 Tax=Mycoplasmopsis felifaucium TaxID=35768 RepID=UPI00068D24AA|nr:hypothetical protein [Mycoplasmopsis felifaucium]
MKIPTYLELGVNIKALFKKNNIRTWEEAKTHYSRYFCIKLKSYLTKINKNNTETFKALYRVIFYYGFIAYLQEYKTAEYLESKGWTVYFPSLKNDAINKIDLIAYKNGKRLYIQVKSNYKQIEELKAVNNFYSKESNSFFIFAVVNSKSITFYDILHNKVNYFI